MINIYKIITFNNNFISKNEFLFLSIFSEKCCPYLFSDEILGGKHMWGYSFAIYRSIIDQFPTAIYCFQALHLVTEK